MVGALTLVTAVPALLTEALAATPLRAAEAGAAAEDRVELLMADSWLDSGLPVEEPMTNTGSGVGRCFLVGCQFTTDEKGGVFDFVDFFYLGLADLLTNYFEDFSVKFPQILKFNIKCIV